MLECSKYTLCFTYWTLLQGCVYEGCKSQVSSRYHIVLILSATIRFADIAKSATIRFDPIQGPVTDMKWYQANLTQSRYIYISSQKTTKICFDNIITELFYYFISGSRHFNGKQYFLFDKKKALFKRRRTWTEKMTQICYENFKIKA